MTTFQSIADFQSQKPTVLTIGTFDGIHVGHKKILERLVDTQKGLQSVVLTFFPHPRMVLQKGGDIKLIHTIKERTAFLEQTGIDSLIIQEFSKEFSRLTATEFVRDILVHKLNIKHIIIGYDHRFGRNRTANIDSLKEFGLIYDFTVEEISAQDINAVSVSSTKIRTALENGDLEMANKYLGVPFQINGVVHKGKGIGKTIGFPTANIYIEESYKIIPKNGVYIATAIIAGKTVLGMMNIGTNPTVNNNSTQHIEIHLFNFNNDIYNQPIKVSILKRIRDEQKFENIQALKTQLAADKQEAIAFFS